VRIRTYQSLENLAREHHESISDALERLVEEARRSRILEGASEAYAAVAADPDADRAWRAEIALWDRTVADGLAPEPDSSEGS
jgi:hypothetical protein